MDFTQTPCAKCLACILKSILLREQIHYTVFVTWGLLLCGGGHTGGAQGAKRATKWNCFYKSVSHYAFSAPTRKPVYTVHKQKVYESFGKSACNMLSCYIHNPGCSLILVQLYVKISCLGLQEAHPHKTMLKRNLQWKLQRQQGGWAALYGNNVKNLSRIPSKKQNSHRRTD